MKFGRQKIDLRPVPARGAYGDRQSAAIAMTSATLDAATNASNICGYG
jgi:hypothetical protein